MNAALKKSYIRLIYARMFRYFSFCLVLCALAAGIYRDGLHIVYALCATGSLMLCWGWFSYLHMTGMRIFGFNTSNKKKQIPYILKRFKDGRPHRPSFRMDTSDFDDDLTSSTSVDEERFSEKQRGIAQILSRVSCGVLLILLSFLIKL